MHEALILFSSSFSRELVDSPEPLDSPASRDTEWVCWPKDKKICTFSCCDVVSSGDSSEDADWFCAQGFSGLDGAKGDSGPAGPKVRYSESRHRLTQNFSLKAGSHSSVIVSQLILVVFAYRERLVPLVRTVSPALWYVCISSQLTCWSKQFFSFIWFTAISLILLWFLSSAGCSWSSWWERPPRTSWTFCELNVLMCYCDCL